MEGDLFAFRIHTGERGRCCLWLDLDKRGLLGRNPMERISVLLLAEILQGGSMRDLVIRECGCEEEEEVREEELRGEAENSKGNRERPAAKRERERRKNLEEGFRVSFSYCLIIHHQS